MTALQCRTLLPVRSAHVARNQGAPRRPQRCALLRYHEFVHRLQGALKRPSELRHLRVVDATERTEELTVDEHEDVRPAGRRSAKHRQHAEVLRVPKTFSTASESKTSEDNPPVGRYQRPAVLTRPQRKAIDRAAGQVGKILNHERCGRVG